MLGDKSSVCSLKNGEIRQQTTTILMCVGKTIFRIIQAWIFSFTCMTLYKAVLARAICLVRVMTYRSHVTMLRRNSSSFLHLFRLPFPSSIFLRPVKEKSQSITKITTKHVCHVVHLRYSFFFTLNNVNMFGIVLKELAMAFHRNKSHIKIQDNYKYFNSVMHDCAFHRINVV